MIFPTSIVASGMALAALLQTPPVQQRAPALGSISGIVVRAGSDDPLPNVQVTLVRADAPAAVSAYYKHAFGGALAFDVTFPADELRDMKLRAETNPGVSGREEDQALQQALLSALPLDALQSVTIDAFGRVGLVSANAPPVITDGVGRFAFAKLEPGTYRLVFAASGYLRLNYGQHALGQGGAPIVLESGQIVDGLKMAMMPTGAISGRITDASGQPAAVAPVQLIHVAYNAQGKKSNEVAASTLTDDRGEYRFYFLTPGRYYIKAGGNRSEDSGGPDEAGMPPGMTVFTSSSFGQNGPNRIRKTYTATYHPRNLDTATVSVIEVASGADVGGIDVTLAERSSSHAVSGTVVDAATGQPLRGQSLQSFMIMVGSVESGGLHGGSSGLNPRDGSFLLPGLQPGTYNIIVESAEGALGGGDFAFFEREERAAQLGLTPEEQAKLRDAQEAVMKEREAQLPRGAAVVTIGGADVEGVTIRVGKGASIAGRLRIEPGGPGRGLSPSRLTPVLDNPASFDFSAVEQHPKPDGSFRLDRIGSGEYEFGMRDLPEGYYVKSAKWGGIDFLKGPVVFPMEKPPEGTLDVVVAYGESQIDGVVTGVDGKPAVGAQAVLIPERNFKATELFRPVTAEANGRFTLTHVTPGDYLLAVWDLIEPFGYFDPVFLAQAEAKGKRVHVGENARIMVEVEILPLPVP